MARGDCWYMTCSFRSGVGRGLVVVASLVAPPSAAARQLANVPTTVSAHGRSGIQLAFVVGADADDLTAEYGAAFLADVHLGRVAFGGGVGWVHYELYGFVGRTGPQYLARAAVHITPPGQSIVVTGFTGAAWSHRKAAGTTEVVDESVWTLPIGIGISVRPAADHANRFWIAPMYMLQGQHQAQGIEVAGFRRRFAGPGLATGFETSLWRGLALAAGAEWRQLHVLSDAPTFRRTRRTLTIGIGLQYDLPFRS